MAESGTDSSSETDGTSVHYFNPNCDSVFIIPGAVVAGTEFRFAGTVNKQPKSFVWGFQKNRTVQAEVDIRYEVNFEKHLVVIDSKFGKAQRVIEDESKTEFPFKAASSFVILIKVCDGSTELKINEGKTFVYLLEEENLLAKARYANISGDVQIRKFSIVKPKTESLTYDLLIPGNVQVGDIYTFISKTPSTNNQIDIQFLDQSKLEGDVWFSLTSVFTSVDESLTIIRKSKIAGAWVHEEKSPHKPLPAGQPFIVDVVVERDSFRCWVNEKEFCKYTHRKPYDDISGVLIDKTGVMNSIKFDRASNLLPPQLTVENSLDISRAEFRRFFPDNPELVKLTGKMKPGRCIMISGVFKEDARRFQFSLDKGVREDTVVYECKAFFKDNILVQTYRNVEWGPEEPIQSDFPFSRGSHFHVQLICDDEGGFQVAVDGIPRFGFPAHLDCGLADYLYVFGDARISRIACF